jgi:hypothetical protein
MGNEEESLPLPGITLAVHYVASRHVICAILFLVTDCSNNIISLFRIVSQHNNL